MPRYDVAVIGMGSAGIVAAEFAATLGLSVCAIERDRLGGDCLWTGCVPSKALLASAKVAQTMRDAAAFGIEAVEPSVDTAAVLARVRAIQARIAAEDDSVEHFAAAGVDVVLGAARLTGPTTIAVAGHGEVEAKHVLLCTGSRPAVPQIPGLAEAGFLTTETLWDLEELPSSLVVIGGGYVALELAQACTRLGCPTTVLEAQPRLLAREEPVLAARLLQRLRAEGVVLETGVEIDRVDPGPVVVAGDRSWPAEAVLVATGRAPNVESLGLEGLGITVGEQGIEVDGGYATSVPSVHAVGDVAGRWRFTHSAGFEAARAVRNAVLPGSTKDDFVVPWCTFTDPELAHVGLTEAEAREQHGGGVQVHRQELADNDRARAEGHDEGAIIVVTVKGVIVGGHVLAPGAGEVVHELALAVHQGSKLADLASMVHVYPTLALGVQQVAAEVAYAGARKWRFLAR